MLLRHGETEWSRSGQHTGRTDVPLTPRGEADARDLAGALGDFRFALVLASPCSGRDAQPSSPGSSLSSTTTSWSGTTAPTRGSPPRIRDDVGYDWTVFEHGVPPGETPGESVEDVAGRAARVVRRATEAMTHGDVALVAHGHLLRVLAAVFLRQEPRLGAQLLLDAGAICVLEYERERPAIRVWNQSASGHG